MPQIDDLIYFNEKEYGRIKKILINETFCFKEFIFENFLTKKDDSCYLGDLRINKENKWVYYPTGV